MKTMQSFLMFFYILDMCYDRCPENDLGGFLGSISPELWEDGKPIDKAVYDDWKDKNNIHILNNQNIIEAIYDFLEYYEKQYGYDFKETKKTLENIVDDEVIEKAAECTRKMYRQFIYSD